MVRALVCIAVLATVVFAEHDENDVYASSIGKSLKDGHVIDGTDAISRFLGFKCPKGYRCLPVLECLPCDYGTYKSEEGSDLCENCPNGCTTLRKGAKNWKECVPKCPPGFEESKCGKTCTKCRPGYYKNNWKNKMCKKCPESSNWKRNMVGMKKKSQCYKQIQPTKPECHGYTGDVILALDASAFVSEEDFTQQLHAVNNFIEAFDVTPGDDGTRFVVFTFCDVVGDVIYFDEHATKTELQDEISGLRWHGSDVTNISAALEFISDEVVVAPGNRYDVPDTVIVVVNGESSSPAQTAASAARLKTDVDKVIAVGIGGDVNMNEIYSIASQDDYSVIAESTEELAMSLPELTKDACELLKAEPEDPVTESTPTPEPDGDGCTQAYGTCTHEEYEETRLRRLKGVDCRKFCQCATASTSPEGANTYYWEEHECASGTIFNSSIGEFGLCGHESQNSCEDDDETTTHNMNGGTTTHDPSTTQESTTGTTSQNGDRCTQAYGTCTQEEYDTRKHLNGVDCLKYCQCAPASESPGGAITYYWEEQTCAPGTIFVTTAGWLGCEHAEYYDCEDYETTTQNPGEETTTQDSATGTTSPNGDLCIQAHGTCTKEEYDNTGYKHLNGVDCLQYCQCAPASTSPEGTITYYWQEQWCAPGTISVKIEGWVGCQDAQNFDCIDYETTTQDPGEETTQDPGEETTTQDPIEETTTQESTTETTPYLLP